MSEPGTGEGSTPVPVKKGMTRRNFVFKGLLAALGLVTVGTAAGCTSATKATPASEPTPYVPTEAPAVPNPEEVRKQNLLNEIWGRLKQLEKKSQHKFSDLSIEFNREPYYQVKTESLEGMNVRALPETFSPEIGKLNEGAIIRARYVLRVKEDGTEVTWLVFEREDTQYNTQNKEQLYFVPVEAGKIPPPFLHDQVNKGDILFVCKELGGETFLVPFKNPGENIIATNGK